MAVTLGKMGEVSWFSVLGDLDPCRDADHLQHARGERQHNRDSCSTASVHQFSHDEKWNRKNEDVRHQSRTVDEKQKVSLLIAAEATQTTECRRRPVVARSGRAHKDEEAPWNRASQ
jgi:hypothetical protein